MPTNIEVLWRRHWGQLLYVIGSGPTAAPINRVHALIGNATIIGINETWRDWRDRGGHQYWITHHYEFAQKMIQHCAGHVVVSDEQCGLPIMGAAEDKLTGDFYTYHHAINARTSIDLRPLLEDAHDTLVMSDSTTAEAVHLAYNLGAAAIILVGVDGAPVNGQMNYPGYNRGYATQQADLDRSWPLLLRVIDAVRAKNVFVGSCQPWIGLDLEGHAISRQSPHDSSHT